MFEERSGVLDRPPAVVMYPAGYYLQYRPGQKT